MSADLGRPLPLEVVGRVVALWRYPVKSMGEEALRQVDVGWHGLAGDRRWTFVRPARVESGFPWLTIRERPNMSRYRPSYVEPDRPDGSAIEVTTPAGEHLSLVDPALAAELGDGVRVMKQDRGVFDTMPLSLITTQTVASLGALVGVDLDVQRFRPNLLIEATDDSSFPEDAWVGCTLRVGSARMRVDKRDQRCVMVNVDPSTSRRDPRVLRTIVDERQNCLGVYGSTVSPGPVAIGDSVLLEPRLQQESI
jgi:uncharacterized protein YcbX